MKKILYFVGILFLAGCEFDTTELEYKENPFVIFTAVTSTVNEGSTDPGNTVKLTVSRGGTGISEPLEVNFNVLSAKFATTGVDASNTFTLMGDNGGTATTVTIPADKTTATISFTTKGNTIAEKDKIVEVQIVNTSKGYNLGYPGPSSNNRVVNVTIKNDD